MPLAEGQQIGTVRVFVGLKINQHIADLLAERARLIESAPNRFVAREDIHPTLVAPWDEVFIEGTVEKLRAALRGLKPFTLVFTHLSYWPDCHRPRLLCAECAPSDDLRSCSWPCSRPLARPRISRSGPISRSRACNGTEEPQAGKKCWTITSVSFKP